MFLTNFIFNQLKFFNIFSEYFIGIMVIYLLVVFILLASNIYGILIQRILSEVISFILLLNSFLVLNENYNLGFYNTNNLPFLELSVYTKAVLTYFAIIFFIIVSEILKNYKLTSFEYLLLLYFTTFGLLILCGTNDFLSTFIAIELISLCSYLLAAFRKVSTYSVESGIKYLLVGATSSAFFLFGSALIYSYFGTIFFDDLRILLINFKINLKLTNLALPTNIFTINVTFKNFLSINDNFLFFKNTLNPFNNFCIEIGLLFLFISIFIKLALAPLHLWSLDVYEGAPSVSTFFFGTVSKFSFFVLLTKLCFIFYLYADKFWVFYNILIGFLSVIFGSFGGIRQKKIKTLLAYSSVSHMGYALLALTSVSTLGFEMLYFYLFSYIISNIIVWYVILSLNKIKKNYLKNLSKNVSDFALLSKSNKFLAFGLITGFFSLAGIPPLFGFMAKFGIFLNLINKQFYLLACLIILCSVVSTFYYIRLIKVLYFENILVGKLYFFNSNCGIYLFSFCIFSLFFLFFNPTFLYLFIHKMVLFENVNFIG